MGKAEKAFRERLKNNFRGSATTFDSWGTMSRLLSAALREAREEERERCAGVAEAIGSGDLRWDYATANKIAAAIRRGR